MPTVLASEQCLRSQSGCEEVEFPCPTCEMARPSMTQTPQSRGLVERSMPTNLNSVHFPSSKEWFVRLRSQFVCNIVVRPGEPGAAGVKQRGPESYSRPSAPSLISGKGGPSPENRKASAAIVDFRPERRLRAPPQIKALRKQRVPLTPRHLERAQPRLSSAQKERSS